MVNHRTLHDGNLHDANVANVTRAKKEIMKVLERYAKVIDTPDAISLGSHMVGFFLSPSQKGVFDNAWIPVLAIGEKWSVEVKLLENGAPHPFSSHYPHIVLLRPHTLSDHS